MTMLVESETETLVSLAQRRNVLIPRLIKNGEVYKPSHPKMVAFSRVLSYYSFSRVQVQGADHLAEAVRLREKHPLIVTSNHQTDVDAMVVRRGLEKIGFGSFADRLFYLAGLKMIERWSTRYLMGTGSVVYVATPFDRQRLKQVLSSPEQIGGLSLQQVDTLRACENNYEHLNNIAKGKIHELLGQGYILSLYPETTRSRTGLMQRAPREVSVNFRLKDAVVLPMVIAGAQAVFPPEKHVRWWKRAQCWVRLGEPYPVSELWQRRRGLEWVPGGDVTPADVAMAKLARLAPELVGQEDLVRYHRILAVEVSVPNIVQSPS